MYKTMSKLSLVLVQQVQLQLALVPVEEPLVEQDREGLVEETNSYHHVVR